jgi:ankyrin repeat protein
MTAEFALLRDHGAKDTAAVIANWDALLRASAAGDADRVRDLLKARSALNPQDDRSRAPLIEAARNGHLDVVNVLIDVYGGHVRCDLAAQAADAAARQQHAEVAARLRRVCSR